jgi:hypothetical protein
MYQKRAKTVIEEESRALLKTASPFGSHNSDNALRENQWHGKSGADNGTFYKHKVFLYLKQT